MGCSTSTQTSAVDTTRPNTKPDESNGAGATGAANANGKVAGDAEGQTPAADGDADPGGEPVIAASSVSSTSAAPPGGEEPEAAAASPPPEAEAPAADAAPEAAAPEPESEATAADSPPAADEAPASEGQHEDLPRRVRCMCLTPFGCTSESDVCLRMRVCLSDRDVESLPKGPSVVTVPSPPDDGCSFCLRTVHRELQPCVCFNIII